MCTIDTQRPRVFMTFLHVGCNKYDYCFRALLEALLYLAEAEIKVHIRARVGAEFIRRHA